MRSFSYSQCQLHGSPYIKWHEKRAATVCADLQVIRRHRQLLPDTRLSWQRFLHRQQLLSLTLSTQTEVHSGHGQQGSASSRSVLTIALERGADRLLLSGGLDGRVCLYRLDTPPESRESGLSGGNFVCSGYHSSRGHTFIRPLASSQQVGASGLAASRAGGEKGHAGAVSTVQW